MGKILQAELPTYTLEQREKDAREIGATARYLSATACRITFSGNGSEKQLCFGEEVALRVLWDAKRERLKNGSEYRWWRMEGKIKQGEVTSVQAQDQLVIAEHPYSIQRIHTAPFKLASRKGRGERPSLERTCETAEELLAKIEALGVDYWERAAYLTAGLSNPNTTLRPDEPRRYQESLFVFGVCTDKEGCEQHLLATEHAHRLLEQTADRTIRFWPATAKLTERLRLYDEVADLGPILLLAAIRQALAGPLEEGWEGKPVMELADRIYRTHLNNENRKLARSKKDEMQLDIE